MEVQPFIIYNKNPVQIPEKNPKQGFYYDSKITILIITSQNSLLISLPSPSFWVKPRNLPTLSSLPISVIYSSSPTSSLKSDNLTVWRKYRIVFIPQTPNLPWASDFLLLIHHKKIFFHHVHIKAIFSIYIVEGSKSWDEAPGNKPFPANPRQCRKRHSSAIVGIPLFLLSNPEWQ